MFLKSMVSQVNLFYVKALKQRFEDNDIQVPGTTELTNRAYFWSSDSSI